MAESTHKRHSSTYQCRRGRSSWCCSFAVPPSFQKNKKPDYSVSKLGPRSFPNSPKPGLNFVGRIDPRRILSPGRVSPIDSDPTGDTTRDIIPDPSPPVDLNSKSRSESFRGRNERRSFSDSGSGSGLDSGRGVFDVRLKLRGKNGGGLVLELNSEVLIANSEVFAGLICEYRKNLGSKCDGDGGGNLSRKMCRIEVPDVENLGIFRETIELMFEEDIAKRLLKVGAYRAIDILEVSFLLSVFFFFMMMMMMIIIIIIMFLGCIFACVCLWVLVEMLCYIVDIILFYFLKILAGYIVSLTTVFKGKKLLCYYFSGN